MQFLMRWLPLWIFDSVISAKALPSTFTLMCIVNLSQKITVGSSTVIAELYPQKRIFFPQLNQLGLLIMANYVGSGHNQIRQNTKDSHRHPSDQTIWQHLPEKRNIILYIVKFYPVWFDQYLDDLVPKFKKIP